MAFRQISDPIYLRRRRRDLIFRVLRIPFSCHHWRDLQDPPHLRRALADLPRGERGRGRGKLLGIRPEQVKALIQIGTLSHERLGSALRYARCTEVTDLLHAVDALPLSQPFSGDLPLTTFCTVRSTALAQAVAAWRSGELNGQVTRGEGKGLQALRLSPNALCDRMERRLYSDSSLAETARYLRISLAAIRHLRDAGLLQQVRRRNADTNFQRNLISKASIRAFQRDHITLGQLAERSGVAPMHLARRLDHDGIPALETRHGMVRVYRRDVLPIGLLRGPVPDKGDGEPTPVAWVIGTDVRA